MHSGTGRLPSRTGFPPRDQLPPGVDIEKLPVLGTTWYERGPDYWVRRVWLFLLMALVITLMSLLVGGFMLGIKGSSHTGFVGAVIVEVVWSLVIVVYMMIKTAQRWNNLDPARPLSRRRQRDAAAAGSALGALAAAGIFIGQAFLVIASVLFFGLYVALLIYALLPEWPPEHKARLRLARLLGAESATTGQAPPIALGP